MKTVAEILVNHLKKWEVLHVFGIPGKPIVPLILEIENQGLEFILGKHESGCGYSAAGYALMNNKLGVALVTAGPGGTNALTSAGQAKAFHCPVLFITGQPPIKEMGKALGQDSTMFGTDLVKMFEPVTKFSARIQRADLFKTYLQHALEKAFSGVKGPVHLSIPSDILLEKIEDFELELPCQEPPAMSNKIDKFIEMFESSKKAVILAGKGVHASGSYDEVKRLSESFNIPVMTTPGGKGTFEENHRLSLGALGLGGTDKAHSYIKEDLDLMIVIGSKLSDMSTVGFSAANCPSSVVHFDYDPTFIGKGLDTNTLPIIGDIKVNLQGTLRKSANKRNIDFIYSKDTEEEYVKDNTYISAVDAVKTMRNELPDETILFGDDGSHTFYAIKHFEIRKPGTFYFDDVFGAMGHAIGYSVGAKFANKDGRIACLTGDGCTFMQGMEMSTAANYNVPVTFIIFNNGRLDMVDKGMKHNIGKSVGVTYSKAIDGKKFGESIGIESYKCYNVEELKSALRISNENNRPIVIEVMVDPDEIPPTMKRG